MLRKLLILLMVFFGFCINVNAQEDIVNQINTPLLDKYVALAKEYYPRRKIYQSTAESAKAKIAVASANYLESITATYLYRPNNGAAVDASNPYVVNGFQLGAYVNLGMILRTPSLVKQAKAEHKAASYQVAEYDVILASEVRQKYYELLQQQNELKVKTIMYNDNKTASDGLRYKFEKGEVSLDDYTKAKTLTSHANSEKFLAELNILKAKDALEALIGMKLEEVK